VTVMDDEEEPKAQVRRGRPAFADDVYGPKKEEQKTELCESSLAQRRSANLSKLKELREGIANNLPSLLHKEQPDMKDEQELEFTYDDCDSYQNELAELYSYSEMFDYSNNVKAYRMIAEEKQVFTPFSSLSRSQQKALIMEIISRFESADVEIRLNSSRALLYILQGAFLDFIDEEDEPKKEGSETKEGGSRGTGYHEVDCLIATVHMAYLSFEAGAYSALTGLLRHELDVPFDILKEEAGSGRESKASAYSNSRSASNMDLSENELRCRRSATLADNENLRVILSCLYHMVESMRRVELIERVMGSAERRTAMAATRQRFLAELDEPVEQIGIPLVMILMDMCPPFYNGQAPHYPMRKVMLLIWKILLALLGGWEDLREKKKEKREKEELAEIEDTIIVGQRMKASLLNDQDGQVSRARPRVRLAMSRQVACTGEEDGEEILGGGEGRSDDDENDKEDDNDKTIGRTGGNTNWNEGGWSRGSSSTSSSSIRDESGERTPTADSPSPLAKRNCGLKWKPKARKDDLEAFIQNSRQKMFQYDLPGDTSTLFGLPPPIHASVEIMRKHLYTSLSDIQMEKEEILEKYPFSMKEEVEETRVEALYRMMLPNLSQYVVALLKVLLAAAPSNKAKNDTLNILCDVLTPETECSDVLSNSISLDHSTNTPLEDSLTLTIDIYRHKEVMVKATSSILLLLLKHLRLNHIYQFEFLAQHVSLGNGVPLILKFLDQNMHKYMQSRHELHPYNFPQAAIYYVRNNEWPELNAENVEVFSSHTEGTSYSLWRNVFSSINLLRILNKITKWKHSRTMLLVVFKSAPILKRCLKIRLVCLFSPPSTLLSPLQAIFQIYVLKLLKMQSRYLGRQWRRCNMDVITSIYSKLRHTLGDDWAFANENRTKSWHYRNIEVDLKAAIEKFNARRYGKMYPAFAVDDSEKEEGEMDDDSLGSISQFEPVDNSSQSLLGRKIELGDKFKKKYEIWMEREVMRTTIDWDQLLDNTKGIVS
ncbi:farl-11, partial [Pristionchus pacificus]